MASTNGNAPETATFNNDYRFPKSRKIYTPGNIHPDVRVPHREISLSATHGINGAPDVPNAPVTVYDTSGPYTDPNVVVDIRKGLAPLRDPWIRARGQYQEVEPSYRPIAATAIRTCQCLPAARRLSAPAL